MKRVILLIGSVLALSLASQAGNLVDYGFDQTNGVADVVAVNLAAGDFSGNIVSSDGKANPYGMPHCKFYEISAVAGFALAPDSGYAASYTNLSFAIQMDSNTGNKERRLEIKSSATGTNVLHTLYNYAAWVAAGSNPADDKLFNNEWTTRSLDLTGFGALQNVSESVTFSFEFVDVSTGSPVKGNLRLDDIGVDGSVGEFVPEDILADYGFDQTNGVADASAANLTAGNFVWSTGSVVDSDGKANPYGMPHWKKSGMAATLSFTLTPDEGLGLNCSNLAFAVQMDHNSGNKERKLEIKSSATGTNVIHTLYNYSAWVTAGSNPADDKLPSNNDWEDRNIDLSGFAALQDHSTAVTFIFEFSDVSTGTPVNGNLRLDDVLVNGGVAVSTNIIPALLGYEMGTNTPHVVDTAVNATVLNVDTNSGDTVVSVLFDKTLATDPTPGDTQPYLQIYSTNSRVVVTVEPDPSYEVDLAELTCEMQIQNGGRWVELTSSATGTNVLWAVRAGAASVDAPDVGTGFGSYSIDLSGIPELQDLTETATLQFEYFTDPGDVDQNARNWRFDNLYVYGGNVVLPPTSIEEFGIGTADGTNVVLSWQGNPAGTYTIQRKLDLVNDPQWSNVVENIDGVSGIMSVTNEATEDQAYFRTILVD